MKKSIGIFIAILVPLAFIAGRYTAPKSTSSHTETKSKTLSLVDTSGKNIDWSSPLPKQPTIADFLRIKGITPEQITHFEFLGDKSSYTYGRTQTDDKEEPYSLWVPSGYRRMNIYIKNKAEPAAKLFINETEATHIEGVEGRFMCHGLEEYVLSKLPKREKR